MTARRCFTILWHCVSLAGELDAFNLNLRKSLLRPNRGSSSSSQFANTKFIYVWNIFSGTHTMLVLHPWFYYYLRSGAETSADISDRWYCLCSFTLSPSLPSERLPYFVKYEMLLIKRYMPYRTIHHMNSCTLNGVHVIVRWRWSAVHPYGRNDFFFRHIFYNTFRRTYRASHIELWCSGLFLVDVICSWNFFFLLW